MPEGLGDAAVAHGDGDLVQRFGQVGPKAPVVLGVTHIGARVALDRTVEVGELQRVAVKEHRGVVADHIPVAFGDRGHPCVGVPVLVASRRSPGSLDGKRGFGSPTEMCGESCKGRSISSCPVRKACPRLTMRSWCRCRRPRTGSCGPRISVSHWGGIAAALRIKSPEWSNGAWSFASSAKMMLAVRWLASRLLAERPSTRLPPTTWRWFANCSLTRCPTMSLTSWAWCWTGCWQRSADTRPNNTRTDVMRDGFDCFPA